MVWVGPGGPGGFGGPSRSTPVVRNKDPFIFSDPKKRNPITAGIFCGYGITVCVVLYSKKKITSIKIKIPVVPFGVCFF